MSKRYTVRSHTESYETDSLQEAKSVMESMAITYKYSCVIDNNDDSVLDYIQL
jgi:hypothetical protein